MVRTVVVVPTNRPECLRTFLDAWVELFVQHGVRLVVVEDGDNPTATIHSYGLFRTRRGPIRREDLGDNADLVCRRTDGVRNLGFLAAARLEPDVVITLDDDVEPPPDADPIQEHLAALHRTSPVGWMNTAAYPAPRLRGFPRRVPTVPVVVSHGVWTGVPDFDGETQLELESSPGGIPDTLPYHRGPVPRGCLMPVCGMNLAVRGSWLPHLFFAPMGADSGESELARFADIWAGICLKRAVDAGGGAAMVTGASTVVHKRASDARRNAAAEELGREWNEHAADLAAGAVPAGCPPRFREYWERYDAQRRRWRTLVSGLLAGGEL
jgi:hypothetical protein